MVLAVSGALAFQVARAGTRRHSVFNTALRFLISLGVLAVVAVPLGYFDIRQVTASGFSGYQADLLTYFASFGTSRWVAPIRMPWGGYEGYAYLGLAGMGLLLLAGMERLRKRIPPLPDSYRPLLVVCLLMLVFAWSGRVTFGGNTILILDGFYRLLEPIPSTFRTSGRFVWPLYYAIWIYLITVVCRRFSARSSALILMAALVLHWAEFAPWFQATGPAGEDPYRYKTSWPPLPIDMSRYRALLFDPRMDDPKAGCLIGLTDDDSQRRIFYQATMHHLAINYAYAGRVPMDAVRKACEKLDGRIRAGVLDPTLLYATDTKRSGRYLKIPGVSCERVTASASLCYQH